MLIPREAQEALQAGKTAEIDQSILEQHRYRWLTHASKICNRRQHGRSDSPIVPCLRSLRSGSELPRPSNAVLQERKDSGERQSIASFVLPPYRPRLPSCYGQRSFQRRTYPVPEHSITNAAVDADRHPRSGDRGNVVGDQRKAIASPGTQTKDGNRRDALGERPSITHASPTEEEEEGTSRHTEAEGIRASDADGPGPSGSGPRIETSALALRALQAGDGTCAEANAFIKLNERGDSQAACGRNGSRSRSPSLKAVFSGTKQVVFGEICYSEQRRDICGGHCCTCTGAFFPSRSAEEVSLCRPCWPYSADDADRASGRQGGVTAAQTCQSCHDDSHAGHTAECCAKDELCGTCYAGYDRSASREPSITLPRRHARCLQEYTCAFDPDTAYTEGDDAPFCTQCDHPPHIASDLLSGGRRRKLGGEQFRERLSQIEDSLTMASSELGLDGTADTEAEGKFKSKDKSGIKPQTNAEAEAQNQAVGRRPSGQVPGQVATRIRELELKNAIPMPKHFQPAGHTRHSNNNRPHRSQLAPDEKPTVDLIFPLHVRRFPRRTSDGSPFRPETPIHRSIPEDEPYIHAPQPARTMPMLKDPPEPEPEPQSKIEYLDTSRGNNDGFAIASRYGRRASRNFAVRRNSRP